MELPDLPRMRGVHVLQAFLVVAGLTLGLLVTAFFAYGVLVIFGYEGTTVLSLPLLFALEAVAILGGIHYSLVCTGRVSWQELGWVPVRSGWLALAALTCVAIYVVMIGVQSVLRAISGGIEIGMLPEAFVLFPRSVFGFLGSLVFGAVAVPIAEEFLFRGLLFRWMRDRWGFSVGAVASALVFALAHPPAAGSAPMIFLIGLALAYFYERSGSLWPSMVLHGVNNGIGILFIYVALSLGSAPTL